MNKSDNITFYSHNGWVFKVIQAVNVEIGMDSEQISPVCFFLQDEVDWDKEKLNLDLILSYCINKRTFFIRSAFYCFNND